VNLLPAGFTLVETLVAVVLTLVLAGLMTRTVSDASALWRLHSARLDTFSEARAALQKISRDLASAQAFPEATRDMAVLCIRPHPQKAADAPPGLEFALLAQTPAPGQSDIRAVGYFCAWDSTLNGPVLRRQTAPAAATAEALRNLRPEEAHFFPWNLLPRDAPNEVLAQFAWDLRVQIPGPTGAPEPAGGLSFNRELPRWIEIRFKAVSPSALNSMGAFPQNALAWQAGPLGWGGSPLQRLLLRHTREFATRIPLVP
jgi:type II secretory pathway component PulJ